MGGADDRRAISDCRHGDTSAVMRPANTNPVIEAVHELSRRIISSIDVVFELLATIVQVLTRRGKHLRPAE
jgi:hypothetical protein